MRPIVARAGRDRRWSRAILGGGIGALLLTIGAGSGAARADYQPPLLLSDSAVTSTEFQSATEPAVSADGRWTAFEGVNEGVAGVWERDASTGAIASVATVSAAGGGGVTVPPPTGPSVSASGQFVAFTSETNPDPADITLPAADTNCPEVYVRNMAVPEAQAGAFTLVAALDGTSTPITFAGCGVPGQNGDLRIGGAQAAPGVAISADGSEVAFTVDSASNLGLPAADVPTACGQPDTTCESQVAVRNLAAQRTTIVSATPSGGPTPDGGAYPSATSYPSSGWGQEADQAVGLSAVGDIPASTAAISADGSTVAWMGTNLPAQLPPGAADDVSANMAGNPHLVDPADPAGQEVEPLWRRLSGPGAGQTTRLLAGAGLSFYGYNRYYAQNSESPAILGGSAEADPGAPALSANGSEVVLTADAPTAARLAAIAQYPSFVNHLLRSDLYAIDMSDPGSPRVTALTQITSDVASDGVDPSSDAQSGPAADATISPNGTEIAFETDRTQFSLPFPALVSPPVQYTDRADTYVIDLADGTLQRAISTYDGLAPDASSGVASVDDAGDVAVESAATNLIYGNVNLDGPEVFLLRSVPLSTAVATETLSAIPRISDRAAFGTRWAIGAHALATRTGTVRVSITVPGAGRVSALAAAQLPRGGRAVSRRRIPFRTVAAAAGTAHRRSVVRLTLALRRLGRGEASRRRGLYAHVSIRFSAPGHPALRETIPATFRIRSSRATRRPHHRPGTRSHRRTARTPDGRHRR